MKGLELLESMTEVPTGLSSLASTGSGSSSASHSGNRAPTNAQQPNSAAKRRRARGALELGSPGPSPAKMKKEDVGECAEEGCIMVKSEKSDAEIAVDKDPCLGCKRAFKSNQDFFNLGATTPWAFPRGRGAWRKDCYTTWRTCFSHEHSLILFAAWIVLPGNRQ